MKRGVELALSTLVKLVLMLLTLVILIYIMNTDLRGHIDDWSTLLTNRFYTALVQR